MNFSFTQKEENCLTNWATIKVSNVSDQSSLSDLLATVHILTVGITFLEGLFSSKESVQILTHLSGLIMPTPITKALALFLHVCNSQFFPNIITEIKSRRMTWTGHASGIQNFDQKIWRKKTTLGTLTGVRITLKVIQGKKRKEYERMKWIQLAQDRVQWQALLNTLMSIAVTQKDICWPTEWPSALVRRLCTMNLVTSNNSFKRSGRALLRNWILSWLKKSLQFHSTEWTYTEGASL